MANMTEESWRKIARRYVGGTETLLELAANIGVNYNYLIKKFHKMGVRRSGARRCGGCGCDLPDRRRGAQYCLPCVALGHGDADENQKRTAWRNRTNRRYAVSSLQAEADAQQLICGLPLRQRKES